MTETIQSGLAEEARARQRRAFKLCAVLWTVLVALALWWWLRAGSSATTWSTRVGETTTLAERTRDWFWLLHLNFQRIYPWILFGPYIGWLAWRFSLERERLRVSLPVHLTACVAFAAASQALNSFSGLAVARVVLFDTRVSTPDDPRAVARSVSTVRVEIAGGGGKEEVLGGSLSREFACVIPTNRLLTNALPPGLARNPLAAVIPKLGAVASGSGHLRMSAWRPLSMLFDLLAYGAVAGLTHAVLFHQRYRERERRALALETNLTKARLHALQAQLQPHFLFNTLNAIATLLRRDPRAAEATLTALSDLLRVALRQPERPETTVREELEFVGRYFEIMQTRFGDRLRFEQQVEPAALDCLVPTLSLQPLVENAIRHGIEPSEHGGLVRVTAHRQAESLVVTVQDDGVGPAPPEQNPSHQTGADPGKPPRTGIGLANLRARLEALYGLRQRLDLSPRAQGGVEVRFEVPWRPATLLEPEPTPDRQ